MSGPQQKETISEKCTLILISIGLVYSTIFVELYLVSAADSDLTIRSSDGVLFKVHRKNLELHSDVFADAGNLSSCNEIIDLSETSSVLELLFQFMYRQTQPDLSLIEFELLCPLAEAAEKYSVHSATQVCKIYMRSVTCRNLVIGINMG